MSPEIKRAAALLRAGRLVAFPTETVYGLGANALDAEAVRRIYEAKGRPSSSPLIVHAASMEMARLLAATWSREAERLAARFWPGPLTLVVPKQASVPGIVTAGLDTVGLRVPAHPLALELIREAGLPLAAPSANRFTELSPTTAEHVRRSLGDAVDLILDGGPTKVGIESTVVSLAADTPLLLRPGMVSREELEAVLGRAVEVAGEVEGGAHASPGMHPVHYSPRTPLVLGGDGELPAGRGASVFHTTAHQRAVRRVAMPRDPVAYAAGLYATLHELDAEGWDWIAVEPPPVDEAGWAGVADRLRRAAARMIGS